MRRSLFARRAGGAGDFAFCRPVHRAAQRELPPGGSGLPALYAAAFWASADGNVRAGSGCDRRLGFSAAFAVSIPIAPSGLLISPPFDFDSFFAAVLV